MSATLPCCLVPSVLSLPIFLCMTTQQSSPPYLINPLDCPSTQLGRWPPQQRRRMSQMAGVPCSAQPGRYRGMLRHLLRVSSGPSALDERLPNLQIPVDAPAGSKGKLLAYRSGSMNASAAVWITWKGCKRREPSVGCHARGSRSCCSGMQHIISHVLSRLPTTYRPSPTLNHSPLFFPASRTKEGTSN
jgi:hypothetical protein